MRKSIGHNDVRDIVQKIERYRMDFTKKNKFELSGSLVYIDSEPVFFPYDSSAIPCLKLLMKKRILKQVSVDMGAIKFIVAGADVMRPGITHIEDGIIKDEPVVIVDKTHEKPIAVGIALFSADEMRQMTTGKVIKNIHFVGDQIWNS